MSHQLGHFELQPQQTQPLNVSLPPVTSYLPSNTLSYRNQQQVTTPSPPQGGGGLSAGGAGLIGTGAGMMGQGAGQIAAWAQRKSKYAEQRKANDEHTQMRQRYMSLDVGDPYRDMTNPFEIF